MANRPATLLRTTDAALAARADRGAIARQTRHHYRDGMHVATTPGLSPPDAYEARRRARAIRERESFWPLAGGAAVTLAAADRADRGYWLGVARGLRGRS